MSNNEQLLICIHWVDKEIIVCEKYTGWVPVAQVNADTIDVCIQDVQLYLNHRIQDSCGQYYDGWLEAKIGLLHKSRNWMKNVCWWTATATHFKKKIRGYSKNIPLLKDILDMAYEITKLIEKHPKREAEFHTKQAEFLWQMENDFHIYGMESPTRKILCPTRWTRKLHRRVLFWRNYWTLLKLWGWAQDHDSDIDVKERKIRVLTKMQTLISSMDFACHCCTFPFR